MRLDFRCTRSHAATTEHSNQTPGEAARHPSGGLLREYHGLDADLYDALLEQVQLAEVPRELLRLVIEHVQDGGIIIQYAGSLVLTWPDGGVSRRLSQMPDS